MISYNFRQSFRKNDVVFINIKSYNKIKTYHCRARIYMQYKTVKYVIQKLITLYNQNANLNSYNNISYIFTDK